MAAVESRRESADLGKNDEPKQSMDSSGCRTDGSNDDAMEDAPNATTSMGPPNNNSTSSGESSTNGNATSSAGAASSANQPKVVQTAFIHKLYNMLEDQSIQHLITWSSSNESFLISPSSEFSKVLASYFKHTNISSFVRQLNMYGFHKVSDVFHTASPDSPLWEFKHGGGSFRRGDVNGLRDIKRRASRHALIQRDTYPTAPKMTAQQPPGPPEPGGDTPEARLNALEHSFYDVHARLARSEEALAIMTAKNQNLTESLVRCCQYQQELLNITSDPEKTSAHDIPTLQRDIALQITSLQSYDTPRHSIAAYRPAPIENGPPLSPRQLPQDDPSQRYTSQTLPRPSTFRPLAPSPGRYGSVGHANHSPPGRTTLGAAHHYQSQNSAAATISASIQNQQNMGRRHTSGDIRTQGWHPSFQQGSGMPAPTSVQPGIGSMPSTNWPTTPHRTSLAAPSGVTAAGIGDQQLRDSLARYSFQGSNGHSPSTNHTSNHNNVVQQGRRTSNPPSRPTSPSTSAQQSTPNHSHAHGINHNPLPSLEPSWNVSSNVRLPFKDVFKASSGAGPSTAAGIASTNSSAPPTRRSSLANIQTLLNPAETVEQDEEEDLAPHQVMGEDEGRKRKRVAL